MEYRNRSSQSFSSTLSFYYQEESISSGKNKAKCEFIMATVVLYTNQTDFKQEHLCKQDYKR